MAHRILPTELGKLGTWLMQARTSQGITQKSLAVLVGITQPRLSAIEQGTVVPTLPQTILLARTLGLPLQWFLSGNTKPGVEVPDIGLELRHLGVVDLLIPNAVVPGAFRPAEQVIALAVSGNQPEPRIMEAIPAVLAWNRWSHTVLRAYSQQTDPRASRRLAWLADVVLAIHQQHGFPGGCLGHRQLEVFRNHQETKTRLPAGEDDLGRPAQGKLSPVWKRWRIRYDASLATFEERARHLHSLRDRRHSWLDLTGT